MNNKGTVNLMSGKGLILKIVEKGDKKIFELCESSIAEIEEFKREKEKSTGQECSFVLFDGLSFEKAVDAEEHGKVHYYEGESPSEVMRTGESPIPNYFYKSNRYSKQREYRVATSLSNEDCGEVKEFVELKQKSVVINNLREIILVAVGE